MKTNCPGAGNISGTPTLKLKTCPDCGQDIELFSNELTSECRTCGFVAYNNIISCIRWCKAARECVGDEMYFELMQINGMEVEPEETVPTEVLSQPQSFEINTEQHVV